MLKTCVRENYALNSDRLKDLLNKLQNPAWLCFTWFGLTAGISLLEANVKFTAPLLTRVVALDVGRVVFAALNKVEIVMLILLLIIVRVSGQAKNLWAYIGPLTFIMLAQTIWLLPQLSYRATLIASGIEPAPSYSHAIFAVLELSKLLLLLLLGFGTMTATKR